MTDYTAKYPGMTNIYAEIVALEYDPGEGKYDSNKMVAAWDAQQKLIYERDSEAAKAGRIVGRFVYFGVADGAACYEVCWTKGQKAYLRHIPIGDAWRARQVEGMGNHFKDPANPDREDGRLIQVPLRFVKGELRGMPGKPFGMVD